MRCPNCNTTAPIGGTICRSCGCELHTGKMPEHKERKKQQEELLRQQQLKQQQELQRQQQIIQQQELQKQQQLKQQQELQRQQQIKQLEQQKKQMLEKEKEEKKQKRNRILIGILSGLLALLISRIVVPAVANSITNQSNNQNSGFFSEILDKPNPEFDAFLAEHGLSYTPQITNTKSKCFVTDLGDGSVEIVECGYSGDKMKEQIDIVYYSLSGYTEYEKKQVKSSLKKAFNDMVKNSSFSTVEYGEHEDYYVITLHHTDMTNSACIEELDKMGLIELESYDLQDGAVIEYISMDITTDALLAGGAIQR